MSWMKWLPWRFILRHAARSQGFLDPIALMARLESFTQPSEVREPLELLRAGLVFHARGLINSRVIQHNLDWVWPYWIERQFDPHDESFIPRAFSVSHINLSHRNWTAIGYPDCDELPIVDPRGLLTPFLDGWSLDGWILTEDGRWLLPSRASVCLQKQTREPDLSITTETRVDDLVLTSNATVQLESGVPVCKLSLKTKTDIRGWLVLALRPQNPEGVSFIHDVRLSTGRNEWVVNNNHRVEFGTPAERHHVSDYRNGDVFIHLRDQEEKAQEIFCEVGMVTASALFPIHAGEESQVTASIPLMDAPSPALSPNAWSTLHDKQCKLVCPDANYQSLYDAAVTSLILHSPDDVYPGPYTYKRFWFRDAAFIIHALLCMGFSDRAERALERFPERQTALGYFRSQEGEWDSNGEVLWIIERFHALTGRPLAVVWHSPIIRGAHWIMRKRLGNDLDAPHAGLLPAGFSAEHLGPNDYYYWDDFWGIAGLRAAHTLIKAVDLKAATTFAEAADDFAMAVDRSLLTCKNRLERPAMPASPYRRLDAGAIGSLAAGYPLQILQADDLRLQDCVEFLLDNCFVRGAFFQDMIHSGLNAYLTLHIAQILLRAGDPRYLKLVDAVAALATTTGQWPEAIHPRTGGGCMGDGHHVWASAEWLMMIRNWFVREENEQLILCGGVPTRWLDKPVSFGPAPTAFGCVSVTLMPTPENGVRVSWEGVWHQKAPEIKVRLPGFDSVRVAPGTNSVTLSNKGGKL